MIDALFGDFFGRALIAGIGLALVAGPLGCVIVWRRMSYFGDTMAHSALLGVALSLLLGVRVEFGVLGISVLVAVALVLLQRQRALSSDALLGILSHASLAVGLVLVSFMTWVRIDLMGFLFGDILSVSTGDIWIIYGGGAFILIILARIWGGLLAATVSEDIAAAEGMAPDRVRLILMLLMAGMIAIAIKLVGVLLITSLLIVPAATARRLSTTPEQMAFISAGLGILAVVGGLFGSLEWDTPSGPSIVVAALIIFVISLTVPLRMSRRRSNRPSALQKATSDGSQKDA